MRYDGRPIEYAISTQRGHEKAGSWVCYPVSYCEEETATTTSRGGTATHGGRVGYTWTIIDEAACSHTVDTVGHFNDRSAEINIQKVPSHSEADWI